MAFCAGALKSVGGAINFGFPIPPPQLFPGVFRNAINFALGLNPIVIRGGGTISAVDLFRIEGTLLAGFATPGKPYTLTKFAAGPTLQDIAPRMFTSTTFALGGTLQITVPEIGKLDIAHGAAMYSYPDYVAASAKANIQLGIFVFDGSLGAQMNARTRQFEADISAHICLRGVKIACAGGLGIVSSKGLVACLNIGPVHPGVGLKTNLKIRGLAVRWLQAEPLLGAQHRCGAACPELGGGPIVPARTRRDDQEPTTRWPRRCAEGARHRPRRPEPVAGRRRHDPERLAARPARR